jgi:DNA (cytosine-5)-methyltransferase 1
MLRAIQEIKPKYIVGENVFGLLNWKGGMVFDEVHSDLDSEGYEVQAVVIPAAAVNAPHGRDRVWFVATNTQFKSKGSDGGTNNQTEGNLRRGNEGNVFGTLCGNGVTPNPDNTRTNDGLLSYRNGQKKNNRRKGEPQFEYRANGNDGDVTDPRCNNKGSKTKSERTPIDIARCSKKYDVADSEGIINQKQSRQNIEGGNRFVANNGSIGDVTDTTSPGGAKDNGIGKSRFNDQTSSANSWDNFPTQSPICGGDDGLPTKLDGITFSKWRAESIKAYGNAIVPQVAYEIFKAIKMTNGN